jgi:type II secretory pathway pseudopilin PulG
MEKALNKGTAGVSILEIMISLVLVALALMAITSVFPNINKHRKGIQEADQAKIIAAEVLEGIQFLMVNGDCAGLPPGSEKTQCDEFKAKYKNKTMKVGIVDYKIENWEVKPGSPYSTVVVTVSWTKGGKKHNVKLTGAL